MMENGDKCAVLTHFITDMLAKLWFCKYSMGHVLHGTQKDFFQYANIVKEMYIT